MAGADLYVAAESPLRLAVRTSASHVENRGSIPLGGAISFAFAIDSPMRVRSSSIAQCGAEAAMIPKTFNNGDPDDRAIIRAVRVIGSVF